MRKKKRRRRRKPPRRKSNAVAGLKDRRVVLGVCGSIAAYKACDLVRRLKERGLGILITDHDVREMLKIIDRGYIIYKGQVLVEGSAEFLANDPKAREIYLGPEFNL